MSAIDDKFQELKAAGKKAFIPFVTAGDPSLALTQQVIKALDKAGCAIGEVGIPYSDPIADGPVIQASYTRALDAGVKLNDIFDSIRAIKSEISLPLVSMVSYSIIHRMGVAKYLDSAIASGFAGAIVPDLLVEEGDALRAACVERDFSLIHLVTPTTPQERMLEIAANSTGFIYFVSVTGITGERNALPDDLLEKVQWLRERTSVPICIGFGISKVEHVKLLSPVADGLIVGSAIVRRCAESNSDGEAVSSVSALADELIAAMV